jgi:ribose 1,5-bisphosphokinase
MATLFYLIGPSGVGKDSLLRAIQADAETSGLHVARRYITRPSHPGAENHIELSEADFEMRLQADQFLFAWRSHGFRYAIGREVLNWLEAGEDVVVNGSRAYLETARKIWPALVAVWMTIDESVLRERLLSRKRETPSQIDQRIERNREYSALMGENDALIRNGSSIEDALAQFFAIRERAGRGSES